MGDNSVKKKGQPFFMRNQDMKFQDLSISGSKDVGRLKRVKEERTEG